MSSAVPLDIASLRPAGLGLAQTDLYRAMRAEAAKLDSATECVDWVELASLSQRVLQELGQDLLAAAYWAHAQHMRQGYVAIADGFDAVSQLLETCWPLMSPPPARINARVGAIAWLVERTKDALNVPLPKAETHPLLALQSAVGRLQKAAQLRLDRQTPNFSSLRRVIERHLLKAQTDACRPPQDETCLPVAAPAPELEAPVRSPTPLPPETMRLSTLGEMICAQALQLRHIDAKNITAMRLIRTGLWLHIDKLPPHTSGVTRIAPMPGALRTALKELRLQQQWERLAVEAEKAMLQHRMHLDLQRDAASAWRALGAEFAEQLSVVEDQARSFAGRLPGLLALQAADKTPLADEETQSWLRRLLQKPSAPTAEVPLGLLPASAMKQEPPRANDGQQRFVERLVQAESALAEHRYVVALALFRGLYGHLLRSRLLMWNSELSTRVLLGFWRCLQNSAKEGRLMQRVFDKLARLDAKLAMEIS